MMMKNRSLMKLLYVLTVTYSIGLLMAAPAQAAMSMNDQNPIRKLGRGLANTVGGVLEIPVNISIEAAKEGPVAGLSVGLLYGVGAAVTRILVGAAEVLTFPFPLPHTGYDPIYQPEFVPVQYINQPPPHE